MRKDYRKDCITREMRLFNFGVFRFSWFSRLIFIWCEKPSFDNEMVQKHV